MTTSQWARISADSFNIALTLYAVAMVLYFFFLVFKRSGVARVASVLTWTGLVIHVVSIVTRGLAAQRVPWGNMYEYSTLLSALVVGGYLTIVEWRYKVRALGGFVLLFVVLTMGVALTAFKVDPGPLQPALNSYWLKIHVVAAIFGSSMLALGSGIMTPLYLYKARQERKAMAPIAGGSTNIDAPAGSDAADPPHFESGADEPASEPGPNNGGGESDRKSLLPSSAVIDKVAYKTIAFAFPIWTFAVIAGAIWAERAWGRYWGWDPKETGSFVTWVIFAAYLHARATAGWKGRKAAVIALVGFVALLFTYYAVNLWIVGLHSYKGF